MSDGRLDDVSGGSRHKLRESISALVDGEADELELRRILASADMQEVRGAWRGYHAQRDMLAGADMRFAHFDISQSVQAALAAEAIPSVAVGGNRWWRPLASVAVAASVATVVVMGARGLNSTSNDNAMAQSTVSAGVFPVFSDAASGHVSNVAVGAAMMSSPAIAQPAALDPDQFARQRLQQYLLRHTERAALNNAQGVISFSKVSELGNEP